MKFLQISQHTFLLGLLTTLRTVTADIRRVHKGSNTTLVCEHKPGSTLVTAIWKVQLLHRPLTCVVSYLAVKEQTVNKCGPRFQQHVNETNMSLTIQDTGVADEGSYTCQIATAEDTLFGTSILEVLVAPVVSIKLGRAGSAECRASRGRPAATIRWNLASSCDLRQTTSIEDDNTTTTVSSTCTLVEDNDTQASCTVEHPAFPHPETLNISIPAASSSEKNGSWWVPVAAAVILVLVLLIILLWQRQKLKMFFASGKVNASSSQENPSVMGEDLEPYASFTQKVNSIYDSCSDLAVAKQKGPPTGPRIGKQGRT